MLTIVDRILIIKPLDSDPRVFKKRTKCNRYSQNENSTQWIKTMDSEISFFFFDTNIFYG
jgi:hypothetical protein